MAALTAGDNGGLGERQLTFEGNKTSRSKMISVEIDLTDPADLVHKMELIDLTDEETDMLLEKAISINKQLKKELKKHENLEAGNSHSFVVSAPASGPQQRVMSGRQLSASTVPSMGHQGHHDGRTLSGQSLARLQSGNSLQTDRTRTDPLKASPYSYHSARPIRSMGSSFGGSQADQRNSRMSDY